MRYVSGAGLMVAHASRVRDVRSFLMMDQNQHGPVYPSRIVDPRSKSYAPFKFRGYLPHVYKEGCTYFVTFCLADVVARRRLERRRLLEVDNPTEISDYFEPQETSGARILKDHGLAGMVEKTLLHFQAERYALSAWCVMPNHVHAVVTPFDGHGLTKILHSWKSYSAHEINRTLRREGSVWQKESFDHVVRNEVAFEKFVDYSELNPVAAGLVDRPEKWQFSSARFHSSGG